MLCRRLIVIDQICMLKIRKFTIQLMALNLKQILISLFSIHVTCDRAYVRLGEYDLSTTTDGMHLDVPIIHIEKHAAYNISGDVKNDIMILYLKYDVFNGIIRMLSSIQQKKFYK